MFLKEKNYTDKGDGFEKEEEKKLTVECQSPE